MATVARERRARFKPPARTAPSKPVLAKLYDRDMYRWTRQQARLLRAGRTSELDLENLAEEIESLGNRDYRELRSRLTLIAAHLLKWQFQPEKRTRSWTSTILVQRQEIVGILEQSPSLRRQVSLMHSRVYRDARQQAAGETGLPQSIFPDEPTFSAEQLLDTAFMPSTGKQED